MITTTTLMYGNTYIYLEGKSYIQPARGSGLMKSMGLQGLMCATTGVDGIS